MPCSLYEVRCFLHLPLSLPPLLLPSLILPLLRLRSRRHQPHTTQLPQRVIRFVRSKVLISTPVRPEHLSHVFYNPPRHSAVRNCHHARLLVRAFRRCAARGKGLFVSFPFSIDSIECMEIERQTRRTTYPEGRREYGKPPIIDAIAGILLTQNKINARNVLCTLLSTRIELRERERDADRKKGTIFYPPSPFYPESLPHAHSRVPMATSPPCFPYLATLSHSYTQTPLVGPGACGEYRIITPEGSRKERRECGKKCTQEATRKKKRRYIRDVGENERMNVFYSKYGAILSYDT